MSQSQFFSFLSWRRSDWTLRVSGVPIFFLNLTVLHFLSYLLPRVTYLVGWLVKNLVVFLRLNVSHLCPEDRFLNIWQRYWVPRRICSVSTRTPFRIYKKNVWNIQKESTLYLVLRSTETEEEDQVSEGSSVETSSCPDLYHHGISPLKIQWCLCYWISSE